MKVLILWTCLLFIGAIFALLLRGDLLRLTRRTVVTQARVVGHRVSSAQGRRTFSAIYRFTADHVAYEVADAVRSQTPRPDIGTLRELRYPRGRPELARPPRPLMWFALYGLLLYVAGVLVARLAGWLPAGAGSGPIGH